MRYRITTLKNHKPHSYTLHAKDRESARQKALIRDGIPPIHIRDQSLLTPSKKQILLCLKSFALLLQAKLPLDLCLATLTQNSSNKQIKGILGQVVEGLNNGLSLSESFAAYESVFGRLFLAMLEVGSKTGKLETSLDLAITELEREQAHRAQIQKALSYPCFILACSLVCFCVLLEILIPQVSELFAQSQASLPPYTRLLITIEELSSRYGLFILLGLGSVAGLLAWEWRMQGVLYQPLLRLSFRIPFVGKILYHSALHQCLFVLSALLQAGIDLRTALRLSQEGLRSEWMQGRFARIQNALDNGKSLAAGMQESGLFDTMTLSLVRIAQAPQLQEVLRACATHLQEENQRRIQSLISLIEPLFTLLLGLFVLLLALGIFTPIWNLS